VNTGIWVALIGGVTTVAAAVGVPWFEARTKSREAGKLVSSYRDPLLRAAHDLQRRLYQILRSDFLTQDRRHQTAESNEAGGDAWQGSMNSSLWLFGQYLGWVEILRRKVQFLDLGTAGENQRLQDRLGGVTAALAGARNNPLSISEAEQQAIGEAMIDDAEPDGGITGLRPLSYGEFLKRLELRDAVFEPWRARFSDAFAKGVKRRSLGFKQLARVQRAVVAVVDTLDPYQLRFPRRDERAKVVGEPIIGDEDYVLACFVAEKNAWATVDEWLGHQGSEGVNLESMPADAAKSGVGERYRGAAGSHERGAATEEMTRTFVYTPARLGSVRGSFRIIVSYDNRILTIKGFKELPTWAAKIRDRAARLWTSEEAL